MIDKHESNGKVFDSYGDLVRRLESLVGHGLRKVLPKGLEDDTRCLNFLKSHSSQVEDVLDLAKIYNNRIDRLPHPLQQPLMTMQTQQCPPSHLPHPDYFIDLSRPDSFQNQYISATDTVPAFSDGFSRGSSSLAYPNQSFSYSFNRGELTSGLCRTSRVDHTVGATGLGFSGIPTQTGQFCGPEDDSAYQPPPTWDWSGASDVGIAAPAPMYAAPHAPTYLEGVGILTHHHPSTQFPTPAAMAILLSPHGQSDDEPTLAGYEEIPPELTEFVVNSGSSTAVGRIARPVEPVVVDPTPEVPAREKKHACTMCHKR